MLGPYLSKQDPIYRTGDTSILRRGAIHGSNLRAEFHNVQQTLRPLRRSRRNPVHFGSRSSLWPAPRTRRDPLPFLHVGSLEHRMLARSFQETWRHGFRREPSRADFRELVYCYRASQVGFRSCMIDNAAINQGGGRVPGVMNELYAFRWLFVATRV
jgi:hypothetical protein